MFESEIETVFPAYAGVILFGIDKTNKFSSFPRVCGGDPVRFPIETIDNVFSPRMRG